jgi:hypothetical protein
MTYVVLMEIWNIEKQVLLLCLGCSLELTNLVMIFSKIKFKKNILLKKIISI